MPIHSKAIDLFPPSAKDHTANAVQERMSPGDADDAADALFDPEGDDDLLGPTLGELEADDTASKLAQLEQIVLPASRGLPPEGQPTLFRITDVRVGPPGPSGYPYLALTHTVEAIPAQKDLAGCAPVYTNLSLSPKAEFRLQELRDALGWDSNEQRTAKDLLGQRVWALVEHEEWEGKTRAKVSQYVEGEIPGEAEAPAPQQPSMQQAPPTTREPSRQEAPRTRSEPSQTQAPSTASAPAATPKQIETIERLARRAGKNINTDNLSRAQASETISALIEGTTLPEFR